MKPTQFYNIEKHWFDSPLNGQCYLFSEDFSGVLKKLMYKPRLILIRPD